PGFEPSELRVRSSEAFRQHLLRAAGRRAFRLRARASHVPDQGGGAAGRSRRGSTEFEFRDVEGTLVGFWTPEYAKALNVPGYHLHFVSADRTRGGHLLQCRGAGLRLQIQREGYYHIALPETEDFLKADLRRDPAADLAKEIGRAH